MFAKWTRRLTYSLCRSYYYLNALIRNCGEISFKWNERTLVQNLVSGQSRKSTAVTRWPRKQQTSDREDWWGGRWKENDCSWSAGNAGRGGGGRSVTFTGRSKYRFEPAAGGRAGGVPALCIGVQADSGSGNPAVSPIIVRRHTPLTISSIVWRHHIPRRTPWRHRTVATVSMVSG